MKSAIAAILKSVCLQVATIQDQAQSLGSLVSLNSSCFLYIEEPWPYESLSAGEIHFHKSVGGVFNKPAAELIFLYAFIVDLLELRVIGAAMRGDGVHLISRSYDKLRTC